MRNNRESNQKNKQGITDDFQDLQSKIQGRVFRSRFNGNDQSRVKERVGKIDKFLPTGRNGGAGKVEIAFTGLHGFENRRHRIVVNKFRF